MICAPAIVLDNQDYDILIGTSFLQNHHVEISYNTMTFTILKQVLPIFTTRSLKKVRSINVVIDNKPHHISYILNRKHTHPLPDVVKNDRGIPLRSRSDLIIPSGHQAIIDTSISLTLPDNIVGEVYSPWRQSRLGPFAAPGIIIPGHGSISVLAGNLSNKDMTVKKNQIVAYLHLYHKDNISGFADFGLLSDLGLPDGGKSVHNVIRRKDLNSLTESQMEKALILLKIL